MVGQYKMEKITLILIALLVIMIGCSNDSPQVRNNEKSEIDKNVSKKTDLATECKLYLKNGPPKQMKDYVPGSITEIIISYGAQGKPLDDEMKEMASIVVMESESLREIKDPEIRKYMLKGVELVRRVMESK